VTYARPRRNWNPLPIAGGEPTMEEILQRVVDEHNRKLGTKGAYRYADTVRAMRILPRIPREGDGQPPKAAPQLAYEEGCARALIYPAIAVAKDAINGGFDVPLWSGNDGYIFTFDPERIAESRYRFVHGLNVRLRRYQSAVGVPWARSLTDPVQILTQQQQDRELELLINAAGTLLKLVKNGRH